MAQRLQIWPAIDLCEGRCVRLIQGDYEQETVYGEDPVAMAHRWESEGADFLHIVDLDGARSGKPVNRNVIQAIASATHLTLQVGGGVRDESGIKALIAAGVSRLVVGTQAIKKPDWFRRMCEKYPHKLVLGVDARDGFVATDGWLDVSQVTASEIVADFREAPLAAVVYTDIATDGMLSGPNIHSLRELRKFVTAPLIASGGIHSVEDIQHLVQVPVDGCIVGKAFYEGRLSMKDALAAAEADLG